MAAASVTSWIVVAAFVGRTASYEILLGMLGPLTAAVGTWLLAARVYREHPEQLTGLMAAGFALKMIFLGAYVAVMLRVMRVRPFPFVVSFTGYFIGLYLMEALFLRRLFSERSR